MSNNTIAAIATAINNSGISIIRISGENAIHIVNKIFYSKSGKQQLESFDTHTIHYGYIKDQDQIVDEVMVSIMKAPRSYTMEDTIEINCHGGILVTNKVLKTIIKYGASPAMPGEFTKRAFLNGRIDLSQAEAVMDIITAQSDYALQSSVTQLKGNVQKKIKEIREIIIRDIAYIEAVLDDPEHYEFDHFSEELGERLQNINFELGKLLRSADDGKYMQQGIQTVIVGKPNAGKSSLLNLLVGMQKAIVTSEAGTTRDIIEQVIQFDGICLNIIDTAGIRNTDNVIEKIGVNRAVEYMNKSDLILYVIDGSVELDQNDFDIMEKIKEKKAVVLLNKSDLNNHLENREIEKLTSKKVFNISAKTEIGIDDLKQYIKELFFNGKVNFNDQVYITNARHKQSLVESFESIKRVQKSMDDNMPEDFLTIDLMNAYEKLGEIIGEKVDEDLVNKIFSEFCMGK